MATHLLDLVLLRSVLDLGGDPPGDLLANLAALRADVVAEGIDAHLLAFIEGLAEKTGTVPSLGLVEQHYTMLQAQGDPHGFTGLSRLSELRLQSTPCLTTVDYQYALDQYRDRVIGDGLATTLQVAASILTTGHAIQPPKGPPITLKGPLQAITFVSDTVETLASRFRTGAIEGTVSTHVGGVYQRYQKRKNQPATGVLTGFEKIDESHGGIQPGDLAFVLGFTGQLKSMVALNVAYRAAISGKHVALVPLEQSAVATMDSLAVLHCQHPKFGESLVSVTYDRLKRGTLSPSEEELLQQALHDLQTNTEYGALLYKEPDRADVTVGDIRRWAEGKARQVPLDLLVVDYLGLVNPSSGGLSMRESAIANLAIREAKQMAMSFNRGKGIGVLSPFQSNRDGFKDAEKNGGRYTLRALAWAPEAEKSADLVYTVYRDETMARQQTALLGNLKARDRPLVLDTWMVYANPAIRCIRDDDLGVGAL